MRYCKDCPRIIDSRDVICDECRARRREPQLVIYTADLAE
jgi:RNA polymerase subunit RPABC4/transcription elongation factor Spt4